MSDLIRKIDEYLNVKKFDLNESLGTINQVLQSGDFDSVRYNIQSIARNLPEFYKDKNYEKALELAGEHVLDFIEKFYEVQITTMKKTLLDSYNKDKFMQDQYRDKSSNEVY